ncbi:VOC family protein [Pontibacillus yanchengensis]|uniref:Glyoxalase n=1 Tax=Pontibacillus yanchengensis Y32 TaxID=1385514 RepID=A0A0A2TG71_9BACI|nr:VOC family protein [Pontibacillus yanchengensis]KGP73423.1 glyoxalase [Pontibacillus yanchengensis Y32]
MIKGFGGIFLRTSEMDTVKKWYKDVLKIDIEDWNGTVISPAKGNETVFAFFADESNYFPKDQQVMMNFQVENMEECLNHLNELGVPLVKEKETNEYGTFISIEDPEGRWIEIWEK